MTRGLPLAVWAGVLTAGSALATAGATALVATSRSGLDPATVRALAVGAAAGLGVAVVAVVAAGRLAGALQALRASAVTRLQSPSAPLGAPPLPPLAARATRELAALAAVLEGLHLRARLSDHLAEQHRLEAQTAAAGVFELLSGLVAAEEGARGQLAAELHDTVAQSLMAASSLLGDGRGGPPELVTVADYLQDAEEQVRAVMARTRPPALRDGDLAGAVDSLRRDMQARYALVVRVDWPQAPVPLPLASAVTLYRFFQEALLNVAKHACVDDATLALEVTAEKVCARVSDAGPGFDPQAVRPEYGRHVGLGLLGERARLSGGALQVRSAPGRGTSVLLELPRPELVPPEQAQPEGPAPAGCPPQPRVPAPHAPVRPAA